MDFSAPQSYILTTTQQINLFLAGVGSGKTHVGGVKSGYFITNFPDAKGFVGANTKEQLNNSTLFRFRKVWADVFGLRAGEHYVEGIIPPLGFNTKNHNFANRYNGIISFYNGAVIFKGSLENAAAHDGKEFAYAFLDETKDSKEEDVKEVILTRLRQEEIFISPSAELLSKEEVILRVEADEAELSQNEEGETVFRCLLSLEDYKPFNPLYILTSPSKVEWLNNWFDLSAFKDQIRAKIYSREEFFKAEYLDKCAVISSSYHNLKNLPAGYIAKQTANQSEEKKKMLIFADPFSKTGGEFYHSFIEAQHVKKVEFAPGLPLHLTFDQNVVPYITLCVWQIHQSEGGFLSLRQIDEFCLENPKNTTEALAKEFLSKYKNRLRHKGAPLDIYYYGDPSGRRRSTRDSGEGVIRGNDYDIIRRVLNDYLSGRSDCTQRSYPSVLSRKEFINKIFAGGFSGEGGVEIIIGENCKETVKDYIYLKEDRNGKKLKEKAKNKLTGETYEKYGHASDANDYFLCSFLSGLFAEFAKNG